MGMYPGVQLAAKAFYTHMIMLQPGFRPLQRLFPTEEVAFETAAARDRASLVRLSRRCGEEAKDGKSNCHTRDLGYSDCWLHLLHPSKPHVALACLALLGTSSFGL